jgi:hypothetical protein
MDKDSFEINANEKDLIIIQRHLTKHTARDLERDLFTLSCSWFSVLAPIIIL